MAAVIETKCVVCGKMERIMKRCSRCHETFYCSRDCQVLDWTRHQNICATSITLHERETATVTQSMEYDHCPGRDGVAGHSSGQDGVICPSSRQDGIMIESSIQDGIDQDCCSEQDRITDHSAGQDVIFHRSVLHDGITDDTLVQKGIIKIASGSRIRHGIVNNMNNIEDLNAASTTRTGQVEDCVKSSKFTHSQDGNGDVHCVSQNIADTSTENAHTPSLLVNVKYVKAKYKVKLNLRYTGRQVFEAFSRVTKVPLTGIKVIHKGKLQTEENVLENVFENATFLVIGEMAEDEEGLDVGDIELIMKQLSVERNVAVKALHKTNCLLDAIFEIGNG